MVTKFPLNGKQETFQLFIKKGKKDEYENYRGISVLNIISRLYGKIMKYFLEQEFSQIETEEQAVFRAGRSTIDHVFCLKQPIEKKMSVDQPLHLLSVDIEKTNDFVLLKNVWNTLEHYYMRNRIIRAIKRLYENYFSKIKIGKKLSSGFYVTKGLRQRCSLSPT
jgi:ribosomal protein L19